MSPKFESALSSKFQALQALGFETPSYGLIDNGSASVASVFEARKAARDGQPCDVDGIVFTVDDTAVVNSLGSTNTSGSSYRNGSVALKFEAMGDSVEIKDIEWSFEGGQYVSPVAIFDPINLVGANITRASLKSYGWMKDNNVGIGSIVRIVRSGDVIPTIPEGLGVNPVLFASGFENNAKVPSSCPHCNSAVVVDSARLRCSNETCPAKEASNVNTFLKAAKIKGMAYSTALQFTAKGYGLQAFMSLRSGPNMMMSMQAGALTLSAAYAKISQQITEHEGLPLDELLGGLPIRMSSAAYWKAFFIQVLGDEYIALDTLLEKLPSVTEAQASAVKYDSGSLSGERGAIALNSLRTYLTIPKAVANLRAWEQKQTQNDEANVASADNKGMLATLSGKRVVFTGTAPIPRDALKARLKAAGAIIQDGVSGTTDYLFLADVTSNTNKAKDARRVQEQGGKVVILSYSDLLGL